MKIKILYEDSNILVIDKPAGVAVHPDGRSKEQTISDWFLKNYPKTKNVGESIFVEGKEIKKSGIVHRLDKDTSGVMVIARNQESFEYLKSLFKTREIKKIYVAVVLGVPKERQGIIDRPIGIRTGTTKRSVESKKMAKPAVTEYEVLKTAEAEDGLGKEHLFALLSVSPKTGRTHQIRVHLTHLGHPLIGDPTYGRARQAPRAKTPEQEAAYKVITDFPRQALHAWLLGFQHPSLHKTIRFESAYPADMADLIAALRRL